MRDSLFFSYSHKDVRWLNELKLLLAGVEDRVRLNVWDDSRIAPSDVWQGEIDEALATAAAAVLLLSPDFFASDYISKEELPPLLRAAGAGELRLFPVIVSPCSHAQVTAIYQSVNDPIQPLATSTDAARQAVWSRLLAQLTAVGAAISDESRIEAEMARLENDLAARPEIKAVNEKIEQARRDPELQPMYRESAVCMLEGRRCQLLQTALMEEMERLGLNPFRNKAIVRTLESVCTTERQALARATELTQLIAADVAQLLKAARESGDEA